MSNSSPERIQTSHEWQEKDEFNLLLAVQAIAQESVENYNPKINLFDRIEKFLNRRFGYEVILSKIKELKKRFYRTKILTESNFEVEKNRVFLISKGIWGRKENNGELRSNRSLGNENVGVEDYITGAVRNDEVEDNITGAVRNEMIETEEMEEGAQSGSGNETIEVEDGQSVARDVGDESMEIKDKSAEQSVVTDSGNEMLEVEDATNNSQSVVSGSGNKMMEMQDVTNNSQSVVSGSVNEMMEVEDVTNNPQSVVSGSGNEMMKMEDATNNSQRDVPDVIMEMKDKQNTNLGNEMMEMEDMKKDAQRDFEKEMMETNDKKNDIKRGLGHEKTEMKNKEKGKQSVKAVRIGVKCSEAIKLNSIVSTSVKILKHAIKFKHKQKQLNFGGNDAKSKVKIQPGYKVLKNSSSMQKDSNGERLCFRCGKAGHMKRDCTLEKKPFTEDQSTRENDSNGERLCFRCGKAGHMRRDCTLEKKIMEPLTEDQSTQENDSNGERLCFGCGKAGHMKRDCTLEKMPVSKKQTVLLKKRKQQQNLKSQPISKKQNTSVKCYDCGNLGHIASTCVQRKVVENPSKKQETTDNTKAGQPETTSSKAVESSREPKPIRSESVPKEHTTNKNFEEKATVSESCSYHNTSDNTKTESSGNFKSETTNNKNVESSNGTKPIRSERGSKEHRSNKNSEEKATISWSGSCHQTFDNTKEKNSGNFKSDDYNRQTLEQGKPPVNEPGPNHELTSKKNSEEKSISPSRAHCLTPNQLTYSLGNSISNNNKRTSEQTDTNELRSNSPHKSTSAPRMKSDKCSNSKSDSNQPSPELRRESLSNNCGTVHHQFSYEHKKELSNSRRIDTHHHYNQYYDEWRQNSVSRSPSVHHGRTDADSYHSTPSRRAEDVHRFQSVSHQYSFENMSPRTHNDCNSGHTYTPNNYRLNASPIQGGYHHLMAQRPKHPDYQHFRGPGYDYSYRYDNRYNNFYNNYTYNNGLDVAGRQSYARQPPLPTEPYPYPPPPPSNEPYWFR